MTQRSHLLECALLILVLYSYSLRLIYLLYSNSLTLLYTFNWSCDYYIIIIIIIIIYLFIYLFILFRERDEKTTFMSLGVRLYFFIIFLNREMTEAYFLKRYIIEKYSIQVQLKSLIARHFTLL